MAIPKSIQENEINKFVESSDVPGKPALVVANADGTAIGGGGGSGNGAILDGVSSLIKATVLDLTSSNPLTTALVDASGDQITSFGGGTQYTEGDTDATITGTALLFEGAANALVAAPGTAANGLDVDVTRISGTVTVDGTVTANLAAGTNNIGDVDVLSSALPTGASTSAKQDTVIGHLDGVEGLLTTIDGDTGNISTKIDTIAGAVAGTEMQVDVLTSALPTGAATSAKQDTMIGHLDGVEGILTTIDTDTGTINETLTDNILGLNSLAIKSARFALIKKNVLAAPQTVSGNGTMAYDGNNTVYFYIPATTNSQIYSYNILTGVTTALTNGTTLAEAYAGATMIYVNGKLYFTRGGAFTTFYSINVDGTSFTTLAACSSAINFGCAMAWDGDNYIYLINNVPGFARYSISGNTWAAMTAPATTGTEGITLAFAGKEKIYSMQGAGATGFAVYDVSGNAWTSKAVTPANVYDGGALAWNGDQYMYAFGGNGSQYLWRYDLIANSWEVLDELPLPASTGSTLIPMTNGTFLAYIAEPSDITTFGIVNNLYTYDPYKERTLVSIPSSEATINTAVPSKALYVGVTDGTNIQSPLTASGDARSPWLVLETAVGAYNGSTIDRMTGTTANGLDVDVTRLPALVAGTANIGDVDIASIAAGDNNIGNVDIVTLPALVAGTANIGDVDVLTLPSIPAGTNNIGDVDVLTLPATPAGTNAIGKLLPPDIDVTAHTNYAKKYYTNAGAVTDGIVWSPAAGKRFHVVSMHINSSAAATVTLEDDKAGGDEAIWKMDMAANSGETINFSEMYPLASGEDAADLIVTTSAGNIYITVTGYEI